MKNEQKVVENEQFHYIFFKANMGIYRSNTISDVEAALNSWAILGRHESIQDVPHLVSPN